MTKCEFLRRVSRVRGPNRSLHEADPLASLWINKLATGRVSGPLQDEPAFVQLLHQPVYAPRRIGVGYRVAQDFGKALFGGSGSGLLMGDPAFDRLGYTLRPLPCRLQLT